MSLKELSQLVRTSADKGERFDLSCYAELNQVVPISLGIDREKGDYYYEFKLTGLVNKEFDKKLIIDHAWKLMEDGDTVRYML